MEKLHITCWILQVLGCNLIYSQQNVFSNQNIEALTAKIEQSMIEKKIPGIALSIVMKDSIIYSGGLGFSNLETNKAVDPQDLFQLGAIAKNFTALGIISLINEGKLKLDDELKKITPEIDFQNKWEISHPIRVVNLLEHTTGFGDIGPSTTFNLKQEELVGIQSINIFAKSLNSRWKPNQRISYSNLNYMVLGYIIEKLSGESMLRSTY